MRTGRIKEGKQRSSLENRNKMEPFPVLSASSRDQPQAKETDGEDHTLTASVFGNHLILEEIFKHLQVADLLKCSMVNSFWKSNARIVLRENNRCLVRIRKYNSCVDLKNFVDLLPRFHKNEIPFNGLSIRTPWAGGSSALHENDCIHCHDPSTFTESLLSLLSVRYLKLGWVDHISSYRPKFKCPTASIVKKIVAGSSSTLEGLQFVFFDSSALTDWNPMSLLKYFLDADTALSGNNLKILFPKLKFLETPLYPYAVYFRNRTEELLDMAPRIQHLMGQIEPRHAQYLLKFRKVDILKQFIFKPGGIVNRHIRNISYNTDYDEMDRQLDRNLQLSLQLAMEQPKLEKLTVQSKLVKRINPGDCAATLTQITEICRSLFESSFTSLHSLRISHLDLLVLQRSGGLSPTKVKQLTIYYMMFEPNQHNDTTNISMDLERIQFSKIFPYLEGVKLYGTKQDFRIVGRNIMDLERACMPMVFVNKNGDKDSCTSASKLKLKSWILYDWYQEPGLRKSRLRTTEKRQELRAHEVTKDEGIMKSMQDIYRTIFPNVTEFTYRHDPWRDLKGICKYFWTTWNNLERITIYEVRHEDALTNLDSDFLGMAEEQCRLLRQSDDCLNFFQQNQLGTSIRNLTKLKLLRIEIQHNNRVECCKENSSVNRETTGKPNTDPDLVFLSAAAATCTIAQMPKLTLEFVRQTCKPTNSKCRLTCHHLSLLVRLLDSVDIVRERLDDEQLSPNRF